jgi:hypothetical protein
MNILKEFIKLNLLNLEDEQKDFKKTLKNFANKIGGKFSPKDGDRGPHIRFNGTPADLRARVKDNEVAIISPGNPDAKSGKFPTYIFKFESKDIPVVLIDLTEKNILSSGKMLGYGAEHAVYSALNSGTSMRTNIENDSRLKTALSASPPAFVKNFYADCDSMKKAFGNKINKSTDLKGLEAKGSPPSGGNDLVDVAAVIGDKKYNIHVKYRSDRLVGLQLPKFDESIDEKNREETLNNHPSVIYRRLRDAFAKDPAVIKSMDDNNTSEINAIFLNVELRNQFYSKLLKQPFLDSISNVLKSQLGLNVANENKVENTLFVNFLSPTNVIIQKLTGGQDKNITFSIKIPGETGETPAPGGAVATANVPKPPPRPTVKGALQVDATVKSTNDSEITIIDVLKLEFGSAKRRKGIDVHKGKNYDEFIDYINNQSSNTR